MVTIGVRVIGGGFPLEVGEGLFFHTSSVCTLLNVVFICFKFPKSERWFVSNPRDEDTYKLLCLRV